MKFGSPLKQDPGWCPDGKPAMMTDSMSFKGPFRHITACLEKTGNNRKNRWCLMFITSSMMIIMPVPHASLKTNQDNTESAEEPKQAKPAMRQLFLRNTNSVILERLDRLVLQYREKDSDKVFIAEPDTKAIPLDTVKEVTITWVSSSGRYSGLLFPFSMYPAEPANAGYRVNYEVEVTTGKKSVIVITPFSHELRQTLRDLLGERVLEIPDEYAPLL
ncbi:MAG: hypothetical protein M0Q91_12325 [Methanoregula sp.]|jgi:hypothetical protein|nr:hypothetical protein [Methanoregula sp.]